MNKALVLFVIGSLLLFGCISAPEQPTKEELAGNLSVSEPIHENGLIEARGDAAISVVKISSYEKGGKLRFPVGNYTDEFMRVGLHSDAFIRLNNSQLMFLDDEESVWLHPMMEKNQTVLFDAIYSREIKNCSISDISVLGKRYQLSMLQDGSSFDNDDKWKIGLEKESGCLKRIVIYLDGYFYDLKDEQITLFRNDNTVLFRFKEIEAGPYVEVVGTMPSQ